ncbi:MAG TPA: DUF3619 family protein, partial [Thiolinea sp.]|nr:DUF3619 family protein [Thiolinea sp.]
MDNKRDQELLKALNQGLNRATENLDPSIQLRLQQARQKALLELNTQGLAKSQRGFAVWLNQLQFFNAKSSSVIAGALGALVLTLGVQLLMNHSSDNSLVNSELKP